jgi:hypothetical protein
MFLRHSYLSRGYYADQLERWLSFFPVENFLVLWSEDFFTRPNEALDRIAEFLSISPARFSGVDRNYSIPAVVQKDMPGRTAESMPAWAIARLQQENKRLLELLGRRLPSVGLPPWLTASGESSGEFVPVARVG